MLLLRKRISKFSFAYCRSFHYLSNPILKKKYKSYSNQSKRTIFGGIIRSTLRLLKYPAILGSVGAGSAYAANKQIDEIKEKFPNIDFDHPTFKYLQTGFNETLDKGQGVVGAITGSITERIKANEDIAALKAAQQEEKKSIVEESNNRSKALSALREEINKAKEEYKKQLEKLKQENNDLRKELLLQPKKGSRSRSNKSLIDMYSEVLDQLSDLDSKYNAQDQLPRVVVIGDQSSGKTSVLEMIAQARIFPRGSGEMMTRSPVKVTLSEGPYHVATFKDSPREYDLTKETDLAALRSDIETKMKSLVREGQTISSEVISLNVKGPGLQRIVLVDLPGIISTVTSEMDPNTRTAIRELSKNYMSNPNAIILCIQDGSIDAERSNVTDLVSSVDPQGKRTLFVLTKVDLAESNSYNPERIKKILQGKLFPMKALGYFAVVTGKGNNDDTIDSIREYEEKFFENSTIFSQSSLKSNQTTKNLSKAVSERFWKCVRDSVEQQADLYRATRFNLETEWKHNFSAFREMDREALFDKGRNEVLDLFLEMHSISTNEWEEGIRTRLWNRIEDFVFDNIFLLTQSIHSYQESQIKLDILLKEWATKVLPEKAIVVGRETLYYYLNEVDKRTSQKLDAIFKPFRSHVLKEARQQHSWDEKAFNRLKIIQTNALEDESIIDKKYWDESVTFMFDKVNQRIASLDKKLKELQGPDLMTRWTKWRSTTEEQRLSSLVISEITNQLYSGLYQNPTLSHDDLSVIKRNLNLQHDVTVNDETITTIHGLLVQKLILSALCNSRNEYKKAYYLYSKGFLESSPQSLIRNVQEKDTNDFREVILFARILKMIQSTTNALRQQIINDETGRLESIVKQKLNNIGEDPLKLKEIFKGRRVTLAEELKQTRYIQEKLEEFIEALQKGEN